MHPKFLSLFFLAFVSTITYPFFILVLGGLKFSSNSYSACLIFYLFYFNIPLHLRDLFI